MHKFILLVVLTSFTLIVEAQETEDSDATTPATPAEVPSENPGSLDDLISNDDDEANVAEAVDEAVEGTGRRQIRRLGDVTRDAEEQWTLEIPQGLNVQRQSSIEVQLPDAQLNTQLQEALYDQANDPNSQEVADRLAGLVNSVEQRVDQSLAAGNIPLAATYLDALVVLDGGRNGIPDRQVQLQNLIQVDGLQELLGQALTDERLLEPEGDNVLEYASQILALDETNEQALSSRNEVQQRLLVRVSALSEELNFEQANELLEQVAAIPGDADIDTARQAIVAQGASHASTLESQARDALDAGNVDLAEQLLNELIAFSDATEATEVLRKSIADVRQYGGMVPGQVFRDSYSGGTIEGPIMIVLPAGSFMMGSPDEEEGHRSSESPRIRVTFERGFALSQREVSVDEFRQFIQNTGYRTDAERLRESTVYDHDTGRLGANQASWQDDYTGRRADDDLPVVHISWNDANAYVAWLAEVTERSYRLPSESELGYAIRGGSQTRYWWGNGSPSEDNVENVTGSGDISESRRRWNDAFDDYEDGNWGPAAVASFQPNPFGLYDINGNVKEWTADCWHVNYTRAPTDGSAWVNAGCESRVVRGSDWSSPPIQTRSAMRVSARMQTRGPRVGIRIARDL